MSLLGHRQRRGILSGKAEASVLYRVCVCVCVCAAASVYTAVPATGHVFREMCTCR